MNEREWIERFEAPERVLWQKPAEVMGALGVRRGQSVADIGAGTGYFAIPLGRAVGREGRVYAVELDPSRVSHLSARAAEERAAMVVPILGRRDDPALPGPVDLVFLCNTYHHIEHRPAYFGRVLDALAETGRIAVVDWRPSSPLGPPPSARVTACEVARELRALGLRVVDRERFLPHQFFLTFGRRRRTARRAPRTRAGHFGANLAGTTRAF